MRLVLTLDPLQIMMMRMMIVIIINQDDRVWRVVCLFDADHCLDDQMILTDLLLITNTHYDIVLRQISSASASSSCDLTVLDKLVSS